MKHIYFVRHGQTLMNKKNIHQRPEEPLTDKGSKQAHEVALELKRKNIDTIISSPFVRARQTAEIIGAELHLPIIFDESVVEFRRPEGLYGRSHYTPSTLLYVWKLFTHRLDPHWNDDGAENMFAIRNRIRDVKRMVANTEGERIVVVSHSIFMDMFAQAVCADRELSFKEFVLGLFGAKKIKNTGVIAFQVDESAPAGTCNWWLLSSETSDQYLKYR